MAGSRWPVDGTTGSTMKYTEPYLLVKGLCGDRLLQENYYLPCTNGDVFKDIIVLLDGEDDSVVRE